MGLALESLSGVESRRMLCSGVAFVRFDVVGEHRPAGPGAFALGAFEAAASEAVAAFQVRDSALGADAVAGETPLCPFRAG